MCPTGSSTLDLYAGEQGTGSQEGRQSAVPSTQVINSPRLLMLPYTLRPRWALQLHRGSTSSADSPSMLTNLT